MATEYFKSELTAILSADVKDYSRLIGEVRRLPSTLPVSLSLRLYTGSVLRKSTVDNGLRSVLDETSPQHHHLPVIL